jgi:gas vesicle protein
LRNRFRRIHPIEGKGEHKMADNRDEGPIATSLLTFLLGVAVGATVAILFAPQAGSETRAQIAEKAGQLKDKAGELKTTVTEKATDWKEKAAALIQRAGDSATDTLDAANEAAKRVADAAKS